MAISICLFIWYEWLGGREFMNYQDVIVLKENVLRGQEIKEENLKHVLVEKNLVINQAVSNDTQIVGLEAKHFIPANEQLHPKYFEDGNLVLKEGQYVAQIPVEWTLAVPDSMRRGDQILIYSVNYDNQLLKSLQSKQSINQAQGKSNTEDKSGTSSNQEVINTLLDNNALNKVLEAKVAYVKDAANREVVNIGEGDRLDGSSAIHAVEIITTTEQFAKIEAQINKGSKLIMMYTDSKEVK